MIVVRFEIILEWCKDTNKIHAGKNNRHALHPRSDNTMYAKLFFISSFTAGELHD